MLVTSPPLVRNIYIPLIFISLYSHYMYTIIPSSGIFNVGLPTPQCYLVIFHLLITVFFNSKMLSMKPLSSVLSFLFGIVTGNETFTPSDVFEESLAIFRTILSRLDFYLIIPLTKALLLVITEALIIFSNRYENMVFRDTTYRRLRNTVTSCEFTMKVVL